MQRKSHGDGRFSRGDFLALGKGCVFESGVLVFHPENIWVGDDVYIGHQTILKGYFKNEMHIGSGTWVGQQCFFHAAGGLRIADNVGIGPAVKIITSLHEEAGRQTPILHAPIRFAPVTVEADVDIGVGTTILPGVTIGKGAQVGAGSVVTKDVAPYSVVAGVPATQLRLRP